MLIYQSCLLLRVKINLLLNVLFATGKFQRRDKEETLNTYFLIKKHTYLDYNDQIATSKLQQAINDLCKKIKNADHEAQAELLVKITEEIDQFIREENGSSDRTDGAFDVLSNLVKSVHEDFEELIDADSVKKKFIKALSKSI